MPETKHVFSVYSVAAVTFPWRNSPQWDKASSLFRLYNHTHTHHTR